jgi:hypothetical protein
MSVYVWRSITGLREKEHLAHELKIRNGKYRIANIHFIAVCIPTVGRQFESGND